MYNNVLESHRSATASLSLSSWINCQVQQILDSMRDNVKIYASMAIVLSYDIRGCNNRDVLETQYRLHSIVFGNNIYIPASLQFQTLKHR